jgi:hypothetical protein
MNHLYTFTVSASSSFGLWNFFSSYGSLRYGVVDQKSAERDNERLARYIASTVLGGPVKRFDYGTAPRQLDALIHYPASRAALEIESKAQWGALRCVKHQIRVPGLRQVWHVLLSDKANINRLKRELPALLLTWHDIPPPNGRGRQLKSWTGSTFFVGTALGGQRSSWSRLPVPEGWGGPPLTGRGPPVGRLCSRLIC